MMMNPNPNPRPPHVVGGPPAMPTPPGIYQQPIGGPIQPSGPGAGQLAMMALQNPEIQKLLGGMMGGGQQEQQMQPPPMPIMQRPQWAPPLQAAPMVPLSSMFA